MHVRVLLIGRGFLGERVSAALSEGYRLRVLTHRQLELTDPEAVLKAIQGDGPEVVLLTAAVSDTGYAQEHPEESFRSNVLGPAYVAEACRKTGAKLVYMSSDQVYNGCLSAGPLPEDVRLSPETVYGQHKLMCEERVHSILPEAVGLRLTWMYDRPDTGVGPAGMKPGGILQVLAEARRAGRSIRFPTREYRGLTNVWRVAQVLPSLWTLPGGVYNCGGGNRRNTYETALLAAEAMRLGSGEGWLIPDEARYSAHPRNLLMDTGKLAAFGVGFPDTAEGLLETMEGTHRRGAAVRQSR